MITDPGSALSSTPTSDTLTPELGDPGNFRKPCGGGGAEAANHMSPARMAYDTACTRLRTPRRIMTADTMFLMVRSA